VLPAFFQRRDDGAFAGRGERVADPIAVDDMQRPSPRVESDERDDHADDKREVSGEATEPAVRRERENPVPDRRLSGDDDPEENGSYRNQQLPEKVEPALQRHPGEPQRDAADPGGRDGAREQTDSERCGHVWISGVEEDRQTEERHSHRDPGATDGEGHGPDPASPARPHLDEREEEDGQCQTGEYDRCSKERPGDRHLHARPREEAAGTGERLLQRRVGLGGGARVGVLAGRRPAQARAQVAVRDRSRRRADRGRRERSTTHSAVHEPRPRQPTHRPRDEDDGGREQRYLHDEEEQGAQRRQCQAAPTGAEVLVTSADVPVEGGLRIRGGIAVVLVRRLAALRPGIAHETRRPEPLVGRGVESAPTRDPPRGRGVATTRHGAEVTRLLEDGRPVAAVLFVDLVTVWFVRFERGKHAERDRPGADPAARARDAEPTEGWLLLRWPLQGSRHRVTWDPELLDDEPPASRPAFRTVLRAHDPRTELATVAGRHESEEQEDQRHREEHELRPGDDR
jgi:hypothetical protein